MTGVMYSVRNWLTTRPPTTARPERLAGVGAFAVAQRDRQGAEQRGHRGHHDGAEAQQAALARWNRRRCVPCFCESMAKSIIMMAFFFTTPNSMMMPTKA